MSHVCSTPHHAVTLRHVVGNVYRGRTSKYVYQVFSHDSYAREYGSDGITPTILGWRATASRYGAVEVLGDFIARSSAVTAVEHHAGEVVAGIIVPPQRATTDQDRTDADNVLRRVAELVEAADEGMGYRETDVFLTELRAILGGL